MSNASSFGQPEALDTALDLHKNFIFIFRNHDL